MARSWNDVRAEAVAAGRIDEQLVENAAKEMRDEVSAYKLKEIRRRQGVTQESVAAGMGVKQPRVSAIERGEIRNTEYGTLKAYVEGLGGHLKMIAEFGDSSIVVAD